MTTMHQYRPINPQLRPDGESLAIPSMDVQKFSPVDKYLIGDSAPMRILKRLIEQVAITRSTALITGESGTGKELVARAIHDLSNRANGPFQAINCGAFPESLLEDELFGHLKGSFTGATSNKKGLFAAANGGTVFLDELGEMPLAMQVKLLRVLQERTVRPLGSTEYAEIEVDIRVVAATNKNLKSEIESGHFRHDLFFRLNVFALSLPPLRARRSDIPALANHLLSRVARNAGLSNPVELSDEALSLLCRHRWPGNVRELENVLERLSVLAGAGATIKADQVIAALEADVALPSIDPRPLAVRKLRSEECVIEYELEFYEQVLKSAGGNYSEAARRLRLKRTTFCYRLDHMRKQIQR